MNVLEKLQAHFPEIVVENADSHGLPSVETTRERLLEVLEFLKTDDELQFHFLTTLCAVHFPDRAGRELLVVYHLHSMVKNERIRVKIHFPITDPHAPSATSLWPAANWMERQEFDFFGIEFDGHPDLRRILNVEDLDVFPMRKEFRLEDGTRTDKDDRYFGRDQHAGQTFERRPDRTYLSEKN